MRPCRSPLRSPLRRLGGLLLTVLVLGGCSDLGGTGDLDYVQGTGNIAQIAVDERGEPVEISGTTLQGDQLDLADLRGQVVVVNVWGAWCTPCRSEAPLLRQASEQLDAAFVGIDIRDSSADTALAFEREYGITYPSIYDESSSTLLAFGRFAPASPPSTLVLDEEGRVAASISGELTSLTTLEDLVEEAADG